VSEAGLTAAVEKMHAEGVPHAAMAAFTHYYRQLDSGETGMLPEAELEPVTSLPDAEELPQGDDAPLDRVAILKLNGGLGTSMGLQGPKSLLEVKPRTTFLDVVRRQAEHAGAPLVLMNSFATRQASMAAVGTAADDFVQSKVPKLRADDLVPVEWPTDPEKEWAPPGHGDLYPSLLAGGMLDELLGRGVRWAFVSNVDNLGATLDPRILAWVAHEEIPFLMEVADRTEADRKGGHVALRAGGGGFVLREVAQCPEEDLDAFQDVSRHRHFNTNTLWIDLEVLRSLLDARQGVLGLPMIVNRKTVDPSDYSSPAVIQLESAMGAAIDVFEGARALRVPRRRFAPVKTTDDLLAVRSDAWVLREDGTMEPAGERLPVVALDPAYYKLVPDFEARFPGGPPSLVECRRLTVRGDVTFGSGVTARGEVTVEGPERVPDGAVLEGQTGS
jgi:UTP--glucose-1-phosphate uridylyltransferase